MKHLFAFALALAACTPEVPPVAPTPAPAPPSPPTPPVAVAPPPIRITPDAPFREKPPAPGPPVVFQAPKVGEFRLKNGVRVLFVERHDLPIVSVRVVTKDGAGDLAWAKPGVASMTGLMLEQGTKNRTALQVSDAYEALGAHHGAWVDWDSGGASVKVMTDKLEAALAVLSDVVLNASFPADELERLRSRRLAAVQAEKDSPPTMAFNATAAALYGRSHPYGHSLTGVAADVQSLARADLLKVDAALFTPSRAAIVVAGDVTRDDLQKKLEAAFGGWQSSGALPPITNVATPHQKGGGRFVFVDKPGAPQSVVRFAEVGIVHNAPDRDAVAVMNAIFGGMFSSRINLNLREAHGYTYGASSRFMAGHGAGPFVAAASVKADTTAASITELMNEERAMQSRPVTADELDGAKESLTLALPGRFESVDSVTQALTDLIVYDLPLDEYDKRPLRIAKVTAEDVLKAAKAHLHPSTVHVIVVGDRSRLEASLEPLHLGPIEARDAYGDVMVPLGSSTGKVAPP